MRLARRPSRIPYLLAGLALVAAVVRFAVAEQAAITGIDRVYLRLSPGPDQPPLGILNRGDPVNILEIEGTWTKVQTPGGQIGYVYHRYVVPIAESQGTAVAPPTSLPTVTSPQPAPAPVDAAPVKDGLSKEIASLRAEIGELKDRVQRRPDADSAVMAGTFTPVAPASAREPSAGVLAIALVSLVVGWGFGAAFTRRRSRSQRGRLRF